MVNVPVNPYYQKEWEAKAKSYSQKKNKFRVEGWEDREKHENHNGSEFNVSEYNSKREKEQFISSCLEDFRGHDRKGDTLDICKISLKGIFRCMFDFWTHVCVGHWCKNVHENDLVACVLPSWVWRSQGKEMKSLIQWMCEDQTRQSGRIWGLACCWGFQRAQRSRTGLRWLENVECWSKWGEGEMLSLMQYPK